MLIETNRLVLRVPQENDFDAWAAFMADDVATKFLGGPQPRSVAWRGMATMTGSWALRGYGMFSVIERATSKWIGRIGPWSPEGWPGFEVGWGLIREAWGKGYALEAATAAIDWTFNTLGQPEIIHCIDPENTASLALAQKLGSGFRGPGRMPPPFEHEKVDLWGQTAEAWRKARSEKGSALFLAKNI